MKKQIKAMRMDKFLSQTLNVTRTEAKKMLKQGRISKNDKLSAKMVQKKQNHRQMLSVWMERRLSMNNSII